MNSLSVTTRSRSLEGSDTSRHIGHPVPVEILLKEARLVAALVRAHSDQLVAYDSRRNDPFAPALEGLCQQVEELPWRRELPLAPKQTIGEAIELVRRAARTFELVGKQDTDAGAEAFRAALAELKRGHPRPRTVGALGPALLAYARFAEAPSHASRLASRGGGSPDLAARARVLAARLDQAAAMRESTRLARRPPSLREHLLARIHECLRVARDAAKAAYAGDDNALYRRFTSQY